MDALLRILLCLVFPPLAVYDKGCGTMTLVFLLTLLGWLPGTIAALIFCLDDPQLDIGTRCRHSDDVFILIIRYLLCLIFPPLAVIDKGCGAMLLVLLFTLFGWLPGVILAFLMCLRDQRYNLN